MLCVLKKSRSAVDTELRGSNDSYLDLLNRMPHRVLINYIETVKSREVRFINTHQLMNLYCLRIYDRVFHEGLFQRWATWLYRRIYII